jgi:hypothetical protein
MPEAPLNAVESEVDWGLTGVDDMDPAEIDVVAADSADCDVVTLAPEAAMLGVELIPDCTVPENRDKDDVPVGKGACTEDAGVGLRSPLMMLSRADSIADSTAEGFVGLIGITMVCSGGTVKLGMPVDTADGLTVGLSVGLSVVFGIGFGTGVEVGLEVGIEIEIELGTELEKLGAGGGTPLPETDAGGILWIELRELPDDNTPDGTLRVDEDPARELAGLFEGV